MTCDECQAAMLPGATGWVCPNGHGRIVGYLPGIGYGSRPPNAMKNRKGWLNQVEEGAKRMAELDSTDTNTKE